MQGALKLHTRFVLPPGHEDVVEKLRLKGQFSIAGGRFTSDEIQQKINALEPPRPREPGGRTAAAGGVGLRRAIRARRRGAIAAKRDLRARAGVQLAGHALQSETLNFRGSLLMDAKVSQAVGGGIKGMLLKVVDPLFEKNGRTEIPIKISGTRQTPSFGLTRAVCSRSDRPEPAHRGASSMVSWGHAGSVTRSSSSLPRRQPRLPSRTDTEGVAPGGQGSNNARRRWRDSVPPS